MSFANKTISLALTGLLLSASAGAACAQAGGADVPTNAKKEGTKENGSSSTGMSKGEAGGSMKQGGAPAASGKGTSTGGNPGQPGKS